MSSSNPSSQISVADLTLRLNKLQQDLSAQKRGAHVSTTLTIIVGIIAIAALAGYFGYGYMQFVDITKPANVIGMAETHLQEAVPQLRSTLEAEITKSAPGWAESLSKQGLAAIPTARTKLEDYVMEQVDVVAGQVVVMTEDQFRKYLKDHREVLEAGFQELAQSPELAEESLKKLTDSVESEFQTNMQTEAEELFGTIIALNTQLKKLLDGKELDDEERLERRILQLARRIQLEQADPEGTARMNAPDSNMNASDSKTDPTLQPQKISKFQGPVKLTQPVSAESAVGTAPKTEAADAPNPAVAPK